MYQGEGGRKANPPPDVIFAQKATAIVKAAGMDPRSIDLEKFRLNASLVFSRAYSAIYKEKLLTVLNENSSKEDKILNSQLVLDGLFTKTRNPILLQLTGNDLYQGNHRAIGVLVGILFAEGQRLWLEKIKSVQELAPMVPAEDSVEADHDLQLQNAQDVLDRNEDVNDLNDEDLEESNGYGGQEIRESLRTLNKMRSNPEIGAVDLERLLSRIAFLEEQLQKKNKKKHSSTRKGQKKRVENRISEAILQDNAINHHRGTGLFDDNSQGDGAVHTTQSSPRSGTADRKEYNPRGESRSPNRRAGDGTGIAEGRKTRPVSAPSTAAHRKVKSVRQPSNRLYSAAPNKKEPEPEKGSNNATDAEKPKVFFDPALHTFDLNSGRKILLSQAQVEYEERKRSKEAMGNILAISENEVNALMGASNGRDNSPTKAEYPSKSISGDVDKWLQRMRRGRHGESKSTSKIEDLPLPEPRYFAAYQKLEDRDLIITIEHCFNCQHHNVTTRHKEEEYVNHSSTFLRVLAQIAHECGVCARVGVSRFKANVTPKCSTSDQDSRIGAFEIQVAYKQPNGKVVPVLLHSKLTTRRWPSKSVLEKRFRAFVAKAKVSTSSGDSDDARPSHVHMAEDSAEPYPVGMCNWALSPVANPGWSFALTEAKAGAPAPAAPVTGAELAPAASTAANAAAAAAAAASANTITNVQWAFDLRELSDAPPKFAIGSTIRVHQINYAQNCTERHALLAVVKEYADANDPHASDIIVKPMYHVQEVKVPQRNCVNLSSYTDRIVDYTPEQVPIELEVLILLSKRSNLIAWDITGGNGRKEANGDICLSRKAFYTQVRKLAWAAEKKLAGGKGKFLLVHPTTGAEVDAQLSYSEEVIGWVFETFKGEGNMTALEKMVIPPPKPPTKPSAAAVDPTPRSEPSSTARTTADAPSTPAASGRAAPTATSSSKTATNAPSSSAKVAQKSEPPVAEVALEQETAADADEEAAPAQDEPSALTADSAPEDTKPDNVPTDTSDQQPEPNSAPEVGADESSPDGLPTQSEEAADLEDPEFPSPDAGDESMPPPEDSSAPTAGPAAKAEGAKKPSAAHPKRFSSANIVGAVDSALKSKIISSLTYPDTEHDPNMSAMERMAILYQLSDAVFEEAVLESDDRAELPQANFLALLERFGLRTLLSNHSVAETLLLKSQTSSNTPDKPVKVELFMNWLQAGESRKHNRGPVSTTKSDSSLPAEENQAHEQASNDATQETTEPMTEPEVTQGDSPAGQTPASCRSTKSNHEQAPEPAAEQPLLSQRSAESNHDDVSASPRVEATTSERVTPPVAAEGSAKQSPRSTAREISGSAKHSPREELTARTASVGSMKSVANPAVVTARSASAEEAEALEKKQEELRLSLDYQPKEVQINSIVIESDQLVHAFYDSVLVNLRIGSTEWLATSCMPREKGSKRRSYNVKWPELLVSADTFRNDSAYVTVAISDSSVAAANPSVPTLATTKIGESANSVAVPLYQLMQPSFDVVKEVQVEPVVTQKVGAPASTGRVKITIHGNARDPKGLRTARIMSMRPQDLMNIKFDPILPLDDAEDLFESDEESITSAPRSKGRKSAGIPEDPMEIEEEELTRTLYPKASMAKMSMAPATQGLSASVTNLLSEVASAETL